MRTLALFYMVFGLVTITLGIVGIVNADSMISLITGLAAGIGLLGSGLTTQKGKRGGMWLGAIISLANLGWWGMRLIQDAGSRYPAIIMTAMSGVAVILVALILLQPKKRERIF